ncbi:MAG TPA: TPM domain-containing protein [Roseiarcus sp.]|nr:TPM domain-containing protein [Roseiarcus sp.]
MQISAEEASRVEAALHAVQSRTGGKIVCVLARASSTYEALPFVWSALLALIAPWPLIAFTEISIERIYIVQMIVFLVALALLSLPRLRPALTPTRIRHANAHRAALEQFALRGLGAESGGVLIYVSLAERYARIIADEGAAKVIPQSQWRAVVDRLLADMRAGATADALIEAATRCGDLLSQHFPPHGGEQTGLHHFHIV